MTGIKLTLVCRRLMNSISRGFNLQDPAIRQNMTFLMRAATMMRLTNDR